MNKAIRIRGDRYDNYGHIIKELPNNSWWVFRYDSFFDHDPLFDGERIPASRIVYRANSLAEAESWVQRHKAA